MSACTCGCCSGVHEETPRTITNRHGLSAIAYRAGDHRAFLRSMLGTLAGTPRLRDDLTVDFPLNRLTRDRDDFSIALLDAWATAADVLTFYQERIANESYLRTAGERLSVVELTRLIGYELNPGVAASAWLAFTVDDSEGAPGEVAIDAGTKVQSVPAQNEMPQTFETSSALDARAEWNELVPRRTAVVAPALGDTAIYLAGTSTNLKTGDGLLFYKSTGVFDFVRVATATPDFDARRTIVTWDTPLTSNVTTSGTETVTVYAFRVQASLFGHNAPDPRTLSADTRGFFNASSDATSHIGSTLEWNFPVTGGKIFLEGEQLAITKDSLAIVLPGGAGPLVFNVDGVSFVSKSDFAVSGKATLLSLALTSAEETSLSSTHYRATVVFAAPEELPLGESPLAGNLTQTIELDRAITAPEVGHVVLVSDAAGLVVEPASIAAADKSSDPVHTTLKLAAPLTNTFDVATARIFANVAPATHGETFREVLGSGDTPTPFQRFKLSHAPLTYVPSSANASGAASTLQVYVNDILWSERSSLYGAATNERVYETVRDSEDNTYVQFGDGKTAGAPVPSGHDNVRAVYRKGIGVAANVAKNKLTLLMSRPLGLEGADNPIAASGGDDPESIEDARQNAPGTMRTLDRVVSLADYQDFAATFAGVAKAIATWSHTGTESQVFLTIAGPGGATFETGSATVAALHGALVSAGDPFVPLRIESFVPAKFTIAAKAGVDSDRVAEIVLKQVSDALRTAFSFDARGFGDAVDLSDVIAVIHNVAGVKSAGIDLLYRSGTTPARHDRLSAAKPRQLANGMLSAAEILILDAAIITEAP
ncbi:MAG TPA: putative baseplate assembly protein [Thermoanaerobaculia bacterium]|jgi:hypothetical protein|nr:putative baseplate assembly protein [Thermoanaerobaculia bacterium]